jgi:exopolysaccharide biosynthesis polyprenyl glycosylphosphotransferase
MSVSSVSTELPYLNSISPSSFANKDMAPSSLRRFLTIGDAVAAFLIFTVPLSLPDSKINRVLTHPRFSSLVGASIALAAAIGLTLGAMATQRLYLSRVSSMRTMEIARIGRIALFLGAASLVVGKLINEPHIARFPILVVFCAFFFLNIWRMIFAMWLANARRAGRFTRPIILVGANDDAQNLYRLIRSHPELGYRIIGITGRAQDIAHHDFDDTPYFGETARLQEILDLTGVNGALVAGGSLSRSTLNRVVRQLLDNEVHVHMSTGINGIDHRRLRGQSLAYEPMVYVERVDLEGWQLITKRIMDIAIASTVLVLSSPLWLTAALIVKLHDRGPVFFRQERVGRHGKMFRMIKLRSMCIDAEAKLAALQELNVRQGPLFKVARDPRVTPIGRILRATSIDELPQLINVIKGEMSLVGPRPALPREVEKFDDALHARHNVLPGITGLWQVEGRDNPDFSLYQRFDIFYVENWSVALDISILVGTVKVVLLRALSAFRRERSRHSTGPRVEGVME